LLRHLPATLFLHANTTNSSLRKSFIFILPHPTPLALDDFSKDGIYPDSAWWLDKDAFINRDYPIAPPTLGVATLDGVGPSGKPYDITASAGSSSPADTLTSKPINLGGLLPSDSVRLSFFWQAQGRGNFPDKNDSLLLQFKNPSITNDSIAWTTVWFHTGFNTTISDSAFHLVMIKIDSTAFLKNGFQFPFSFFLLLIIVDLKIRMLSTCVLVGLKIQDSYFFKYK